MSIYRKIDKRIWRDAKFNALSRMQPSGQSLWLFLLVADTSIIIPGVVIDSPASIAWKLRWTEKAFAEAFAELFAKGMVEADFEACLIFIPNAVKYNPPANPNVVISWASAWVEVPECELKNRIHVILYQALKGFGEAFTKAFAKGFGEALPPTFPNTGTGTGTGTGTEPSLTSFGERGFKKDSVDTEELRKEWNNSNPARGIGEHDDHGNPNGTGTGTQRHADGGRASGTGAGGRGSSHEPSQSHSDHSDSNKGSGSLPHRQPEPAQTEPRPGDRNRAPLTPAGCGLAPLRRPLGPIGDSQPLPQGPAGDHRPAGLAHALGDTQYPIDIPACGGPDATTNAIAPLDGVAAGQQTANGGLGAPNGSHPAVSVRGAAKASDVRPSGGKKLQTFGKTAMEMEFPDAYAVWKASPAMGRGRSSTMEFLKAWREQQKNGGIPPVSEVLESLECWKRSKKWAENGGEYIEAIHRWVSRRQWENRPLSAMEMAHEQFATVDAMFGGQNG